MLQYRSWQSLCNQQGGLLIHLHVYILIFERDGWLCLTPACHRMLLNLLSAAAKQIYRIRLLDPREALEGTILSGVIYLVYTIHSPHFKGQLPDCYWLLQDTGSLLGMHEEKWQFQCWLFFSLMGESKPLVLIILLTTFNFNNYLLWCVWVSSTQAIIKRER